jgi:hypothetical protein
MSVWGLLMRDGSITWLVTEVIEYGVSGDS